jgi:O-antigen/teichoic acid export membrane protein
MTAVEATADAQVLSPQPVREGRRRRAALGLAATQTRELLKQAVSLFTWPLVVNGLGLERYGLWVLTSQTAAYLQAGDARVANAAGLFLAREQASETHGEKRRLIGAHLILAGATAVVLLALGALLLSLAPTVLKIPADSRPAFSLALGILVGSFALRGFWALPATVLYSQNLAYRGFLVQTGFEVAAPMLSAAVVLLGWGIVGLASVASTVAALQGLTLAFLVARLLPWFGVSRPTRLNLRRLLGAGLRYQFDGLAVMLDQTCPAVLLGFFGDLKAVGTYAVTDRLLQAAQGLVFRVCNAAAPVVGEFSGAGNRPAMLRAWMMTNAAVTASAGGLFLVLAPFNTLVLDLLLGRGRHAGGLLAFALAARMLFYCRSGPPAYFLNQMLRLRQKNRWSLAWAAVLVGLAGLLVPAWGMAGMALAAGAGVLVMQVGYTLEACQGLELRSSRVLGRQLLQQTLLLAAAVGASCGVARVQSLGPWWALAAACFWIPAAAAFLWWGVLSGRERSSLQDLVMSLRKKRQATA